MAGKPLEAIDRIKPVLSYEDNSNIWASSEIIKPASSHINYVVNMSDYKEAVTILNKLLEINPNILDEPTGLINAMIATDKNSFRADTRKSGAIELIKLAGYIKQEDPMEPIIVKADENCLNHIGYKVIKRMRLFLAYRLLEESIIKIQIV
jgi:tetratricopeptide (TPR) repeat protein